MKNNKSAFTLIELLVVIAIIGILATISVLALSNARAKSRDAKRAGDMKQVQTALELFFNDNNRYPTVEEWNTGKIYSTSTGVTSTYMQIIPNAPTPADGTCTDAKNTVGYTPSSDGSTYSISFCLGNTTGTLTPGPKCLTPGGIVDVDCSVAQSGGCNQDSDCTGNNICVSSSCVDYITYSSPYYSCGSNGGDLCIYNVLKIGNQYWLKESLNLGTMLCSGDGPGECIPSQGDFSAGIQKYCYDNNESTCGYVGAMYQWHMAVGKNQSCDTFDCAGDPSNTCCTTTGNDICPSGWHLPTDAEWTELTRTVINDPSCDPDTGCSPAGTELKSGPMIWDGNNTFGFTALPGGMNNQGTFIYLGTDITFWSSSAFSNKSWRRDLSANSNIARVAKARIHGFYTRCVKD
ncbi:MAG: FISUMP domain-containing protein [Candidatus Falkowbacteria bacterium]